MQEDAQHDHGVVVDGSTIHHENEESGRILLDDSNNNVAN